MTIKKSEGDVWMQDDLISVSQMIAEMTLDALGLTADESCQRDRVISRISNYVDHVLNQVELLGRENAQENSQSNSAVPSFPSMVALQIEKIKAAKQIVRSMDGIKEACVQRGRGVEFSEEMASAYETALKFLEGQLKGDENSALEEENQKLKEIRSALNEYYERLKN